ncbi:hypothetical protein [Mucilaginibacter sp.]
MKNPFLIDRSYLIRHKILEVLYNNWEAHNHEQDRRVGSITVANITKISISDIHQYQYLLVEKGEIIIADNDGQSMMSIQQAGISAYIDNRYLKEGRKSQWDNINDWARIIIPLLALILSLFNLYTNTNYNSRIKDLEKRVQQFKK